MRGTLTLLILATCSLVMAAPVRTAIPSRATALRKMGVETFSAKKNGAILQSQADQLTQVVIGDLSAMSYLEAVSVSAPSGQSGRRELLAAVKAANLDGVITGTVDSNLFQALILSRDGEVLARISLNVPIKLGSEAQIRSASKAVVDEIAHSIPYRGFITGLTADNYYELNLGSDQGLLKGQRFHVFDFISANFTAARKDWGEAVVVSVTPTTALIEPSGSGEFPIFGKIGFNENAHGMSVAQQIETRGYVYLGGGFLNVNSTSDSKYSDRGYHIGSAPILLAGGGWGKIAGFVQMAAYSSAETDLVYTEGIVDTEVFQKPISANKFSVRVGGRLGTMGVSAKKGVVTNLQSTTSLSPDFVARIDRVIRGPLRGYVAVAAYVPLFVTGISTSALVSSYGIEANGGISFDLTQRLFIDAGARYIIFNRPVDGTNAVSETYTDAFGDLGYRF
jgi:hypothetical protein